MGDFSLKAILSAVDKNFSSTMKSALGYTNNLKDTLMSGIGFGAMMAIGQTAVSAVTGKMSSLSKETIETSDSMQKLQAAMRFSGYAEDEIQRIAGSTGSLKTYADKTVFSLQDVMSTFGALSANGIKDADKLTEAVGNAVAVFGGGAQEYSSVALAFSQAMAAGALHAQDWNQILNASPQLAGGLRKELIRLNPVLGEDFKGAMEDGAITADMLAEAMNNIGMTDMAKEAATSVTTFEGAMGNLEATTVSGMMKLYDVFAKSKVIDAINELNNKVGARFDWLSTAIPAAIDKISPYWNVFKTEFIEVKDAFGDAVSAITSEVGKLTGAFGSTESVNNFSDVLGTASGALKTFAGFCEEHADVIAKVLTMLPKLYVAYKGFQIVKAVAPFVGAFSGALGKLGRNSEGATNSVMSLKDGLNSLQKSAGIALIIGSLAGLALAIKPLAELGITAVTPLLSFGVVVGGLAVILGNMGKKLQESSVGITVFSVAVSVMALAMAPIAQTGTAGAVAMGAFGVVVSGLVVIFGLFGSALNAAIPGMIAFGVTILAVGAGMALAEGFISVLPPLIKQLGDTFSQMARTISDAVSKVVTVIGNTLCNVMTTAGDVISQVVDSITSGFKTIADGVSGVIEAISGGFTSVLKAVADVIESIGVSAKNAGIGFKNVAEGISMIAGLSIGAIVKSLGAVATGLGEISGKSEELQSAAGGIEGINNAIAGTSASTAKLNGLLAQLTISATAVTASVLAITAAFNELKIPTLDTSPMLMALTAITVAADKTTNSLVNSFNDAAGKAKSAGKETGNGYSDGVQNGLNKLPSIASKNMSGFNSGLSSGSSKAIAIANSMSVSIVSALQSASSGAYNSGYNIGAGLASGMNSALGTVQAAAAQLAAAADAAIRAKAQIHSPSRVSKKEGAYWGQGWVEGILSKVKDSWEAAEELVSMKKIDFPKRIMSVAGSYGGMELSEDYQYNHSAEYTILVPLEIEGREVAKATAAYTQEELTRLEKRNNRKKGKR